MVQTDVVQTWCSGGQATLLSWMIYYARSRLPFFLRPPLLPGTASGITLRTSLLPFFLFALRSCLTRGAPAGLEQDAMGCTFLPVPVEIRETRGLETVVDDRVAGGKELGWDAAQFEHGVELVLSAEGVVAVRSPAEDLAAELRIWCTRSLSW